MNNFDLIRTYLKFENEGDFYFLQIIKRRKDNPDLSKSEKLIDNFYIYSLEEYDNLKDKIIILCHLHNARAYFRLNRRNAEVIGLQTLKRVTDLIINKNHRAIANIYPSVCGEFHQDPEKKWILDLDGTFAEDKIRFYATLERLKDHPFMSKRALPKIYGEIPTKNGCHIIISPCDAHILDQELQKVSYEISESRGFPQKDTWDLHKDSPTLLYMQK